MSLITLLVLLAVVALVLQVTFPWGRVTFVLALLGGALLVWNIAQASDNSLDILTVTLALEPVARGFMILALALTSVLALATSLQRDRVSLAFLYWSWIPWLVALVVSDFVVAVFAWGIGLTAMVLGMQPRKHQRASGAAYFLVLVIAAEACLLLANRFIVTYPLTPERTSLIQLAVLFLAWGFGLSLALFPFHFWVGPMTDDAPLPIAAMLLGLGQPIGLWLLFRLLGQYSWLVDKSNLFELIGLAGLAAVFVGGLMSAFEQRAGRLLGDLAIFTLGLGMLDVSLATRAGLGFFGLEVTFRALNLTILACAVNLSQGVENKWVQRVSLVAFLLAGLNLIGVRLGSDMAERWALLSQVVGTDQRLLGLLILAHTGVLVGMIRFARNWQLFPARRPQAESKLEVTEQRVLDREQKLIPATVIESESVAVATVPPSVPAATRTEDSRGDAEAEGWGSNDGGRTESPQEEVALEGPTAADEYIFEEHVGEIMQSLIRRARPPLQRAARSLPQGTAALVLTVWRTLPVWGSLSLLLLLIATLLILTNETQSLYEQIITLIGQPPFVQ